MAARSKTADTIIIGGGVIGTAIAWRLAQLGVDVVLIERDAPGRGATWAAAGMLSPLGESPTADFLALAQRSLELYPHFLRELTAANGDPIEFGQPGKLEVAFTQSELERLHAHLTDSSVRWLSAVDTLAYEGGLNASVAGAALLPGDAFVDNRRLGPALSKAAHAAGATLVRAGAAALDIAGNRVTGVRLANGETKRAPNVVLAAGAWSAQLGGLPSAIPVEPVRGQMIALQLEASPAFTHILQSARGYLIPRADHRVLVGATVERVGFAPGTTPEGLASLRAAAIELVPALRDATEIEAWYGFRPGTPDDLPILGPDPDVEGLFYATGHFRNGILLAPVTAELIVELVNGESARLPIEAFAVDRFRR